MIEQIIYLVIYVIITLVIAFVGSKKRSDEDYLIAGRNVGIIGFVTSVVASYIGGAALVAYAAYVYQFGISAIAVFLGTMIGFLVFIPYARKIRKVGSENGFYTLSDWLYYKFDKRTGDASSVILIFVYLGMLLNQFIAGSTILSSLSGWSYETSLLLASGIIGVYLMVGGFQSVIRTDIFQYLVLIVILVILANVLITGHSVPLNQMVELKSADPAMLVAFIAFGILIIFQSAEYWQRVYAAKSEKVVVNGFRWSAFFVVVTGAVITLISLEAKAALPGIEPRMAFGEGMRLMLSDAAIGAALIMVFAAIMSSADTQIFVVASALSMDIFGKSKRRQYTKRQLRNLTRFFILLFTVLGFLLAWQLRDMIAIIVFITGVGFTIIPAALLSFHFNIRANVAFGSFIAGIAYVAVLIVSGLLIPEFAIASIAVSFLYILAGQAFYKIKSPANES